MKYRLQPPSIPRTIEDTKPGDVIEKNGELYLRIMENIDGAFFAAARLKDGARYTFAAGVSVRVVDGEFVGKILEHT